MLAPILREPFRLLNAFSILVFVFTISLLRAVTAMVTILSSSFVFLLSGVTPCPPTVSSVITSPSLPAKVSPL